MKKNLLLVTLVFAFFAQAYGQTSSFFRRHGFPSDEGFRDLGAMSAQQAMTRIPKEYEDMFARNSFGSYGEYTRPSYSDIMNQVDSVLKGGAPKLRHLYILWYIIYELEIDADGDLYSTGSQSEYVSFFWEDEDTYVAWEYEVMR